MTFDTTRISVIVDATLNGSTGTITIQEDENGDGTYSNEQTFDLADGVIRHGVTDLSSNIIDNDIRLQIETDNQGDVTNSSVINSIEVEY